MGKRLSPLLAALQELEAHLRYAPGQGLTLHTQAEPLAAGQGEAALSALRDHLYLRYFCRWNPSAVHRTRYSDRASGEPAFVASLLAAAGGATCWEPGWQITKSEGDWAFASNGRLNLFVDNPALLEPRSLVEGAAVRLRLPCARENISPGYFHVLSRAGPVDRRLPHRKLYLNLAPQGAAVLIEALLGGPRVEKLRFEAKVANVPGAYCRVDTGVLYVEPDSYPGLLGAMRAFRRLHPELFREGTPLFTRELAPGLSVAEIPAVLPEGYGQHRCRLAAEEILGALERSDHSALSWLTLLRQRFAREGLVLEPSEHP